STSWPATSTSAAWARRRRAGRPGIPTGRGEELAPAFFFWLRAAGAPLTVLSVPPGPSSRPARESIDGKRGSRRPARPARERRGARQAVGHDVPGVLHLGGVVPAQFRLPAQPRVRRRPAVVDPEHL